MFNHYLKTIVRNLLKNKSIALINILGFAFSISVCIIILLFLFKEYSFDQYHTNSSHIFRLIDTQEKSCFIDYRVSQIIRDNYKEVENASIVQILGRPVGVYCRSYEKDNSCYLENMMSANSDFFKMFTVPFVYGNPEKPFENLNSGVITRSFSRSLFGEENPLGKEITVYNKYHLTISGLIEDFPDNSSIKSDLIVNAENDEFKFFFSCDNSRDSSTYRYYFNIYLQMNQSADIKQFVGKVNKSAGIFSPYLKSCDLLPLKEIYLNDYSTGGHNKHGNPSLLNLLSAIALIVLILAIINYINIAIAQQNKRNKETGIRKTVGAGRKDMVILFLIESVFITFISFIFSLLIIEAAFPYFNNIIEGSLNPGLLRQFPLNIIIVSSILIVGVISGLVPSILLSSFVPSRMLKGEFTSTGRRIRLRSLLTIFQFTVSIALIFSIIVIKNQIDFVKHKDLGFNKDQLLYLNLPDASKLDILQNKLKQYPAITNMSSTFGVPGKISMFMGSAIPGKDESLMIIAADSIFLSTFNIQLIKGRNLLPGDYGHVCMINEAAYKYFEWNDLTDKKYDNGGGYDVIGVVNDFHCSSLHEKIKPAVILFTSRFEPNHINIRIAGGLLGPTIANIQKAWSEVLPDYPLKYHFYDDWFEAMYKKEDKLAELIGLFAYLAITISCLGILGLTVFYSESRTKEIGIRKVLGASVQEIFFLLTRDFLKWVVAANLFAWPLAYYIMDKWLQDFAYRINITLWMFLLSAFLAMIIALLTVIFQITKTARANPINSLKYE